MGHIYLPGHTFSPQVRDHQRNTIYKEEENPEWYAPNAGSSSGQWRCLHRQLKTIQSPHHEHGYLELGENWGRTWCVCYGVTITHLEISHTVLSPDGSSSLEDRDHVSKLQLSVLLYSTSQSSMKTAEISTMISLGKRDGSQWRCITYLFIQIWLRLFKLVWTDFERRCSEPHQAEAAE